MIIWLNGALVDNTAARIDPADRGFLLGDGVFETIAVRDGDIVRLSAHLARLRDSCTVVQIPFPQQDFDTIIHATLAANGMKEAAVRVTVTRGVGARGVMPPEKPLSTLMVMAAPLPSPQLPARCIVARITRRNEQSPLAKIKSLNYLDNILARQEARDRGADDALLLNTAGRLAEATTSNLFIVRDGRVMTPPIGDGALPGIMRAEILAFTKGIETSLCPNDLALADEIFLTNSLGLRRLESVDNQPVTNRFGQSLFPSLAAKFGEG